MNWNDSKSAANGATTSSSSSNILHNMLQSFMLSSGSGEYSTYWSSILLAFVISLATLSWFHHQKQKTLAAKSTRIQKRRLSNLGRTTLVTEVQTNLSIPVSVMSIVGKITEEEFVERLQERISKDPFFIRFRSTVVDGHTFVEEKEFDAKRHVTVHELEEHETPVSFAESIVNTPMDFSKPLWEMVLLTEKKTPTISHVALKIHHCIGDGASLSMGIVKLSDNVKQFDEMIAHMKERSISSKPKQKTEVMENLKKVIQTLTLFVWSLVIYLFKFGLLFIPEPITIFKRPGGMRKRLSYSLSYSVAETKAIGKPMKSTINDIMLSCVTGAIRRSLLSEGHQIAPKLTLRAAVPVDMRSSSEVISSASNKFTALVISLPVGVEDPVERLKTVRNSMNLAKNSFERHFTYWMSHLIAKFPKFITQRIVHFTSSRVTVAVSNVRSSPIKLSMCGKDVSAFFAFVPPPPSVNLGIAILSIGDDLGMNVLVDEGAQVDPQQFLEFARDEFEQLKKAVTRAPKTSVKSKKET